MDSDSRGVFSGKLGYVLAAAGAFKVYGKNRMDTAGGWLNAIIPLLIVPYYSVIGGWVCKYLFAFLFTDLPTITSDTFFTDFITDGSLTVLWFVVFSVIVLAITFMGVQNGIERVSRIMMPVLILLAVFICIYSVTRPGALEGVRYFLVPDLKHFSWMTVVAAMGQMFILSRLPWAS